MRYFYEGYNQARQKFQTADLDECLSLIDDLYGRDQIEDESNLEEVREEALRQLKEEFTDKSSHEYEQVQFWTKVVRAGMWQ